MTTPLDRFIIDANALDVAVMSGKDLWDVQRHAEKMWEQQSEENRREIRDLYRPAYNRVAAAVLREAAEDFGRTDPLETALGGQHYPLEWLRARATEYKDGTR